MSEEMRTTAELLREISGRLADPDLPDEEAEALAREASELAARGGVLLDERLRELANDSDPPALSGPDG